MRSASAFLFAVCGAKRRMSTSARSPGGAPPTIHSAIALPAPPGVGDTGRVEARGDEERAQLGRLAEDEVAVGREALRAVEEHLDARRLEARRAPHRRRHQRLELLPVLVQELELEGRRDRVDSPRLGLRLEAAHQQTADLFLVVDAAVGIAQHRQHRVHAGDLLGDDIEVLRRPERHVDAGQRAELPRPLAGAVDDDLAGDLDLLAGVAHVQSRDAPAAGRRFVAHGDDLGLLDDAHAALAGAPGERHRQVGGVGLAVAGNPDRAGEVVRCAAPGTARRRAAG